MRCSRGLVAEASGADGLGYGGGGGGRGGEGYWVCVKNNNCGPRFFGFSLRSIVQFHFLLFMKADEADNRRHESITQVCP